MRDAGAWRPKRAGPAATAPPSPAKKSGNLDAYLENVDRWTDKAAAGLP